MDEDDTVPKHGNENKDDHDNSHPLVTKQREKIKDTRILTSEKGTHDDILISKRRMEIKDPRILRTEKDMEREQTHDESLPRNDNVSTESFSSRQKESYNVIHKLEGGKFELATDKIKYRNRHVRTDTNLLQNRDSASRQQTKGKMKFSRMFCMTLF